MRLLPMEPLSKLLFLQVKAIVRLRAPLFWMSLHFPWALRLLEVSWQILLIETALSLPNNLRLSPPMTITSQVSSFKYTKERERWPKITTFLVNLILKEFHLLQEGLLKLRSPLTSMRMVSWMFPLVIQLQERSIKSRSQTIRVDSHRRKSKRWSQMLRSLRLRTRQFRRKLNPGMDLRTTVSKWRTPSTRRSSKNISLTETRK